MEKSSAVLVLVANEKSATLHANCDGSTRLLRQVDRVATANDRPDGSETSASYLFACELMMMLGASATRSQYDGVIIFAEPGMMEELARVQTSLVSRMLIARIVGKPTEHSLFPGRSAANAQMAYRGAVH